MGVAQKSKTNVHINHSTIFFLVTSLFCLLFIRKYFILFFPLHILWGFYVFKLKLTKNQLGFILLSLLFTSVSFIFSDRFFFNYIMSFTLVFSGLAFFVAKPAINSHSTTSTTFFRVSSTILIIVNIIAFFYYIIITKGSTNIFEIEDSFTGIYGKSGLGQHALSVVNFIYCSYSLLVKRNLPYFFIFFISGILGFYGLGIILFLTSILFVIFFQIKFIFKYFIYIILMIVFLFVIIKTVNPRNFNYMVENITKTINGFEDLDYEKEMQKAQSALWSEVPRKTTFYVGAFKRLANTPKVTLIGTSPGTYNSMTAFMLNGDYTNIEALKSKVKNLPQYHKEDVYPLWNEKIYIRKWMDGSKNQPFSSFMAIIVEYGIFIGVLYFIFFYKKIKYLVTQITNRGIKYFVLISSVFFGLSTFFLNIIELVDLFFIYLILMKTIEKDYVISSNN